MKRRSKVMLCLVSAMSAPVFSQETADGNARGTVDAEPEFPFINMLEFLGEFETGDGEWINPEVLADEVFAELDGNADGEIIDRAVREQRVLSTTGDEE